MDAVELGLRLVRARELAGITQEGLARAVDLDRTAITRLEKGERKLSVPELVAIATVLGRPLSFFVSEPVPAVISRRRGSADTSHSSTPALDIELEGFAGDVRTLLEAGLIEPAERADDGRTPTDHESAERIAEQVRGRLGFASGPIADLGAVCEALGLYSFAAALGAAGPDGACVEVSTDAGTVGAAVVNGSMPPGRRRMTLAHELAHWLSGDAYDTQASSDNERMVNSLAIHFLAPRAGVSRTWRDYADRPVRDRALAVAAVFKLSWSAAISQLRNIGLIGRDEHRRLGEDEPRAGDYLRLRLSWAEELRAPYLSPRFAAAVVNGYTDGRITGDRAIELLRGTLAMDDLPDVRLSLDDLRPSFADHGE